MNRVEVLPNVLRDLEQRVKKGTAEYGEPLTTHNGRNALQDAYEEALDLSMYLKQALLERGLGPAPWAVGTPAPSMRPKAKLPSAPTPPDPSTLPGAAIAAADAKLKFLEAKECHREARKTVEVAAIDAANAEVAYDTAAQNLLRVAGADWSSPDR